VEKALLVIGKTLAHYRVGNQLGRGGRGEVWKARDTRLGRVVAIKTVKEQNSERFKQEARSIAALNHTNICQIFDIGPDYLVLEYVEGKPLAGPIAENEAIRIAIQIASALEEAHQHGIIHRDLKPSNIMVTDKGSVKQPSARYQTMTELKTALELASTEKTPVGVPEPQPSIAVLPFVNMSGDREQEYFSDGLTEEIINALTNLPGLRVAGRTSSV
jgi:serine/threonine protein kinase